jgi:hypothetical protein
MNGKASWSAIAALALALLGIVWSGAERISTLESEVRSLSVERVSARMAVLEVSVLEINRKLDRIERRFDASNWRNTAPPQ